MSWDKMPKAHYISIMKRLGKITKKVIKYGNIFKNVINQYMFEYKGEQVIKEKFEFVEYEVRCDLITVQNLTNQFSEFLNDIQKIKIFNYIVKINNYMEKGKKELYKGLNEKFKHDEINFNFKWNDNLNVYHYHDNDSGTDFYYNKNDNVMTFSDDKESVECSETNVELNKLLYYYDNNLGIILYFDEKLIRFFGYCPDTNTKMYWYPEYNKFFDNSENPKSYYFDINDKCFHCYDETGEQQNLN